eukprot:6202757-Pleurochrysis_carterae.AAC.4
MRPKYHPTFKIKNAIRWSSADPECEHCRRPVHTALACPGETTGQLLVCIHDHRTLARLHIEPQSALFEYKDVVRVNCLYPFTIEVMFACRSCGSPSNKAGDKCQQCEPALEESPPKLRTAAGKASMPAQAKKPEKENADTVEVDVPSEEYPSHPFRHFIYSDEVQSAVNTSLARTFQSKARLVDYLKTKEGLRMNRNPEGGDCQHLSIFVVWAGVHFHRVRHYAPAAPQRPSQ